MGLYCQNRQRFQQIAKEFLAQAAPGTRAGGYQSRGDERENQTRMESESRDLLTVEQAAAYLQLSQSSIRSYIRQGKLNAFRIAGKRKVLIPRTALLKLLEPARAQDIVREEAPDAAPIPDGED